MTSWIRRIFTLPLFVGILIFSFSTKRSFAAPDTVALERKVAFLPALNMKQPMRADFELTNAKIIGQDETGFFLKELQSMGQLCDLTRVACLNSIGKLLNADLIIQIWTDPKKNDVFRFIDISSAQEIHRQLISKDMTEDEIYIRIKNTYAQMFTSTDNSIATQRHSQPPLPPRPKTTLQESRQPSMQTFAGWSAVAVGGTATLMGSLFFFVHPDHYVSVPSDASQAIQAQVANNQEAKRNVAYALWASGATLTVAGLVQLFHQDDTE